MKQMQVMTAKAQDIKRVVNESQLMAKGLREQAKVLQSAGHNLEKKAQAVAKEEGAKDN